MQPTPPSLHLHPAHAQQVAAGQVPSVVLQGTWRAAQLAEPKAWQQLQQVSAMLPDAATLVWDLRQISSLDHTGAQWLWNTWQHRWPEQVLLLPNQQLMLQRVAQHSTLAPPAPKTSWWQGLYALCNPGWDLLTQAKALLVLLGQLVLDLGRVLRSPRRAPWRDVSAHLYHTGATALPITGLVGFMIGVVLAYLMSRQLRQFGADSFIVNVLGIALVRELGPMLAAILVAGRSGSAITAQIGVMRVTEELDALRIMGLPRSFRLVLPRTLALVLAMPLVGLWTTLAALAGGMLAAQAVLGITPAYFLSTLPQVLHIDNLWFGLGKCAAFGGVIALMACHFGLRVEPNTESLGQGTTASVVSSITLVLLMDAAFAVVFKHVGV